MVCGTPWPRWEEDGRLGCIAAAGTDAEITGAGRVEWVVAGALQINNTSWDVKSKHPPTSLAESGGMVGAMRALHADVHVLL